MAERLHLRAPLCEATWPVNERKAYRMALENRVRRRFAPQRSVGD